MAAGSALAIVSRRFIARYSRDASLGFRITAFPTASIGD
jgi:hypothetical protein